MVVNLPLITSKIMTLDWYHHKDWQGWLFGCPQWYYRVAHYCDSERDHSKGEQCAWQLLWERRNPFHTSWSSSHCGHSLTSLQMMSVGAEGSLRTTLRLRFQHSHVSTLGSARLRSVGRHLFSLLPHSWLSVYDLLNNLAPPSPQLPSGVPLSWVLAFPAYCSIFKS